MEHAAAILVQTIFNSDERMQALLKEKASTPQSAAELFKPWFQAMLMMVKSADAFDQGPTTHQ
jgi:hypothetical protein